MEKVYIYIYNDVIKCLFFNIIIQQKTMLSNNFQSVTEIVYYCVKRVFSYNVGLKKIYLNKI